MLVGFAAVFLGLSQWLSTFNHWGRASRSLGVTATVLAGVVLALILMVFSELVGSSNGIGYEMLNAQNSFDIVELWCTIGRSCSAAAATP